MRDKRSTPQPPEPESFVFADWEHAKLAIQETGGWIKNADTKITILAGSFGVSLTFVVPRLVSGWQSASQHSTILFVVWIILCAALTTSVGVIGANIYAALVPRTHVGSTVINRFAWPSLAKTSFEDLPRLDSEKRLRREAWEQAMVLAQIARDKYGHFRKALSAFGGYLILLVALTVLGASLP